MLRPPFPRLWTNEKQLHIYLDTYDLGSCFDEEFATASRRLFRAIYEGRAVSVSSSITTRELEAAPVAVHRALNDLPPAAVLLLQDAEECEPTRRARSFDAAGYALP